MGYIALWAESEEEPEDGGNGADAEPGEVDASLETRRLRRWLKAMFGTAKPKTDDD